MNELIKVSIAGINLSLEQDAYELLNDYLQNIENKYIGNPDGKEIYADIESRVVELILERQEHSRVVNRAIVETIIERLGYPEVEDQDNPIEEPVPNRFNTDQNSDVTPKRLYRSTHRKMIGGVCRGLSQFFNIDIVFFRLPFLCMFAFMPHTMIIGRGGEGISISMLGSTLVYLALWICIPKDNRSKQEVELNEETTPQNRRIRRSTQDGMVGGVCAGLSKFLNIDVTLLRLPLILSLVFLILAAMMTNNSHYIEQTMPSYIFGIIIFYIVLWIAIPKIKKQKVKKENMNNQTPPPYSNKQVNNESHDEIRNEKFPKRLYRSAQGGVIGGVCSGLSKYFNIHVAWIRLPLIIMTCLFLFLSIELLDKFRFEAAWITSLLLLNSITLFYVVFWATVPMAKSARQKLEMDGENVTVFSIGRRINDDASAIDNQNTNSGISSVFAEMLTFVGKVIFAIFKVILILLSFAVGLPLLLLITVILALIVISIFGAITLSMPFVLSVVPMFVVQAPEIFIPTLIFDATVLSLPILIIPISATLIAIIMLIGGWKRAIAWSLSIMIALWIVVGSYFTYIIANDIDDGKIARQFLNSYSYDDDIQVDNRYGVHLNFTEYYIQHTKTEDSLLYERGTIYQGDTTINARYVTTYAEGVFSAPTGSVKTTEKVVISPSDYTTTKALFILSVIATLSIMVMRYSGKKRFFVLSLTIMIILWIITCAYFIKELHFSKKYSSERTRVETRDVVVGDSTRVDTIVNSKVKSIN